MMEESLKIIRQISKMVFFKEIIGCQQCGEYKAGDGRFIDSL